MLIEGIKLSNGQVLPMAVDDDGKLLVGGITISDITVTDVEISNDTSSPVPVSGPLTDTQLRESPVTITGVVGLSGGVEVNNDSGNPLPVNATVAMNPSNVAVALKVNADGELVVAGLAEMSNHLETIIALLPAALTESGNLKVSIEEDNSVA